MYFVNIKKAFDRELKKVLEWAVRKNGIPDVSVRSVIRLYEREKT